MKSLKAAIAGGIAARELYGEALINNSQIQIAGLIDMDRRAYRAWSDVRSDRLSVYRDIPALQADHPNTELLLLASGRGSRSGDIESALTQGMNVLSDVPFARTLAASDTLLKFAANNSLLIIPIFTHRIDLAYHTFLLEMTSKTGAVLPNARAEYRLSLSGYGEFWEGIKEMAVSAMMSSIDWGRWFFGEALSVSADLHPLLLVEQEGIAVRGLRESQIATILVQYERASCTHQISLARGQTGGERLQVTFEEGTLELTSPPPLNTTDPATLLWRTKSGVEPIEIPDQQSRPDLSIHQARMNRMLATISSYWLYQETATVSGMVRSAQEIVAAAMISSRSQSKVRLPLIGSNKLVI